MDFINELRKGFSQFLSIIRKDGEVDVLLMPYAEYSLQFYVIYKDVLYKDLLRENGKLAQAFCSIGINQPRDQAVIFLNAFYLYWHTRQE